MQSLVDFSMFLHMERGAMPVILPSIKTGSPHARLRFDGHDGYTEIMLFSSSDEQRGWLAAMVEASAAYWAGVEEAKKISARIDGAEEAAARDHAEREAA